MSCKNPTGHAAEVRPYSDAPKGLLRRRLNEQKFSLARYQPSVAVGHFVEHYWILQWDLRGQQPYVSENLPYPSVHMTIEPDRSRLTGVVTGRFSYLLEGCGTVFGTKFRPGAWYSFVHMPVSCFTNRWLDLRDSPAATGTNWSTPSGWH